MRQTRISVIFHNPNTDKTEVTVVNSVGLPDQSNNTDQVLSLIKQAIKNIRPLKDSILELHFSDNPKVYPLK